MAVDQSEDEVVDSARDIVARAQVAKVLELMINSRQTEAEACEQVGVSVRTFQRRLADNIEMRALRETSQAVLVAGVQSAYRAYLDGIAEIQKRITSSDGGKAMSTRDLTAAVKALHLIIVEHANILGETAAPQTGEEVAAGKLRASWDGQLIMTGPVTVHVNSKDGVPVPHTIAGTSTPVDDDDELILP